MGARGLSCVAARGTTGRAFTQREHDGIALISGSASFIVVALDIVGEGLAFLERKPRGRKHAGESWVSVSSPAGTERKLVRVRNYE